MQTTHSDEVVISSRYKDRQHWPENYDYKRVKGARIVEIIKDTGDLPSLALELGVGRGGVAVAVSQRGIPVVGIDLSPEILARARTYARTENVRLLRASGFSLPFRNGSFAVVYASQVLHLFDSPSRLVVMREARRVLRPGGRFVFDMKNVSTHVLRYLLSTAARRQRNYPSKAEVIRLLGEADFSAIVVRPGVLPLVGWTKLPNLSLFRGLAHTTFFVATRG